MKYENAVRAIDNIRLRRIGADEREALNRIRRKLGISELTLEQQADLSERLDMVTSYETI